MPGPSSIRSSSTQQTTFDNSAFGPSITITRKDLAASTLAYQRLLSASKAYTSDILSLSSSSSELASALDECSRLKGSHESSSQLQALSGLYYLVSSYNQVLADSFWKDFSIPLLNHFDLYNATNIDRSITNEKLLSEKSRVLKEMEMKNLKNGRKKERDLNSFRKALNELQQQVEEIDRIKSDYYHELLQSEEECWKLVMEKVALLSRSHLDISERLTSKGSSDPILEPLLSSIPDPFNSYGPERSEDQIFSILQSANNGLVSSGSNFLGGDDRERIGFVGSGDLSPSGLGLMSPSTPIVGLPRSASGPSSKEKEKEKEALPGTTQSLSQALQQMNSEKLPREQDDEMEQQAQTSSALFGSEEGGDLERGKDGLLGPSKRSISASEKRAVTPTQGNETKRTIDKHAVETENEKEEERALKVLSIINESSAISTRSDKNDKTEPDAPFHPQIIAQNKAGTEDFKSIDRSQNVSQNSGSNEDDQDNDEEADFSNDESVRGEKVHGK